MKITLEKIAKETLIHRKKNIFGRKTIQYTITLDNIIYSCFRYHNEEGFLSINGYRSNIVIRNKDEFAVIVNRFVKPTQKK